MNTRRQLPRMALILDDRISRERRQILTRITGALRHVAQVELLPGGVEESEVLHRAKIQEYALILAPWYRYLSWSKVEALYGLTRTTGPTFAGYFAEKLMPYELGEQADHLRAIFLDFTRLAPSEIVLVVQSLLHDHLRAGLLSLAGTQAFLHSDVWTGTDEFGAKMDSIFKLNELQNLEWMKDRRNSLRVCFSALWGLVHDGGVGKSELAQALTKNQLRSKFEIAIGNSCVAIRCLYQMPSWTPKDVLTAFWPDDSRPLSSYRILAKFSDLLRVHPISNTPEIEIAAAFFPSRSCETAFQEMRTFWVEPIASRLIPAFSTNLSKNEPSRTESNEEGRVDALERQLVEYKNRVMDLQKQIQSRDDRISELRSGGVGQTTAREIPDAPALLEAFQERYFDSKFQIRQLELQIADARRRDLSSAMIENLKCRMEELELQQTKWIRSLTEILETARKSLRKGAAG